MSQKFNVLSLFGWAEQGRCVLDRMGIIPTAYFSSEIDEYAIKLSSANFPDIIHIGSVTEVKAEDLPEIDFLIGWPPCQDLSIAWKREWLTGSRSSLFWEYVRILHETKPKFFFMENVASMPKEAKAEITEALFGIEPILINSSLTSAQQRKRLYWFWIRQEDGTYKGIEIPQPKDAQIYLRDILEDIPFDALDAKGNPIWKPLPEKYIEKVEEKLKKNCMTLCNLNPSGRWLWGNVYNSDWKSPTITINKGEWIKILDKSYALTATYWNVCPRDYFEKNSRQIIIGQYQLPRWSNPGGLKDDKMPCMNASKYAENNKLVAQFRRQEKVCTLTANMWTGENNVPVLVTWMALRNRWEGKLPEFNWMEKLNALTSVQTDSLIISEPQYLWRKLIVRECARAQTFPETYTFESVSNSRAYKAIGNSWEGGAIEHNWIHLLKDFLKTYYLL